MIHKGEGICLFFHFVSSIWNTSVEWIHRRIREGRRKERAKKEEGRSRKRARKEEGRERGFRSNLFSWSLHMNCLFTYSWSKMPMWRLEQKWSQCSHIHHIGWKGRHELEDVKNELSSGKGEDLCQAKSTTDVVTTSHNWDGTFSVCEPSAGMCSQSADISIQFLEGSHWPMPSKILTHTHQPKMVFFSSTIRFYLSVKV